MFFFSHDIVESLCNIIHEVHAFNIENWIAFSLKCFHDNHHKFYVFRQDLEWCFKDKSHEYFVIQFFKYCQNSKVDILLCVKFVAKNSFLFHVTKTRELSELFWLCNKFFFLQFVKNMKWIVVKCDQEHETIESMRYLIVFIQLNKWNVDSFKRSSFFFMINKQLHLKWIMMFVYDDSSFFFSK